MSPKQPLAYSNITDLFTATARTYPDRPYLNVLSETAQAYDIAEGEISYGDLLERITARKKAYERAGYGPGLRVGILLENRPVVFEHWLALNALGVSMVPINPELRAAELAYLIEHSEMSLAVCLPERQQDLQSAGPEGFAVISSDNPIPLASSPVQNGPINHKTEAALLYTSGTTGLPKGCVLSNEYFLLCAQWYIEQGGYCKVFTDGERMLTPLPLFHMNALACSAMSMMAVGGCVSFLDRFHPRSWWDSVRESRASIIHYLGVMPAMLMNAPASQDDKDHYIRFGFGAGVDGSLHAPFEARFGFPLIEAWAMTETGGGGAIIASHDPRHVGTHCFGAPGPKLQTRLVDRQGRDVPPGEDGELLVRSAGENPQYGFFSCYLKNPQATSEAWEEGWFHTGDIVRATPDGTYVFVDRKKNVIRRSGENIAAVEVENALIKHELIEAIAVAPVPDAVRGDEVFALIVTNTPDQDQQETAQKIMAYSLSQLAYYKAPGYIAFVGALPLTSTNKIKRGELKDIVADLMESGQVLDMRKLKKRTA